MRRSTWLVFAAGSLLGVAAACTTKPSIDGASVPVAGDAQHPPECGATCQRLADLCGYAPVGCSDDCADGGFDPPHRACVGTAPSCQTALDCANTDPGSTEDTEDAASDAGTDDDASTAALPDPDAG